MLLAALPRIALAQLPTPLHEAPHLSAALGGPRILIKRDDLTGLALGGNKARKLEFVLADAREKGADVIITTGAVQSNHACQTAAAAQKLGMKPILVLYGDIRAECQGNLLLDSLLDAETRIVEDSSLVPKAIDDLVAELHGRGHSPYVIPTGASNALGAVGYVNAALEIRDQLETQGLAAEYLFDAVGSYGTIAGLAVGAGYFRALFQVVGISVADKKEPLAARIAQLSNDTARLLEMKMTFTPDEITLYDEYVGDGYGKPTRQGIEAIRLVAQTEGIFLDPVYTGKGMAGLIDLIRQGRFTSKDTIIFLHTGGAPSIFAYARELSARTR